MQVTTGFKLGSSKVAYTLSFINTTIQDVNSAFSPDQSVLKFCSTAIHCRSTADVSLAIRSHPPSSVIRIVFFAHERRYTKRVSIRTPIVHRAVVHGVLNLTTVSVDVVSVRFLIVLL